MAVRINPVREEPESINQICVHLVWENHAVMGNL